MSSTSLIFKVKASWVPPFQLDYMRMSSCQMGPNFPTWLQTQTSLQYLDISKSGIVDIAPKWFWKWASHIDLLIDLSDNQISGNLSGVLLNNTYIDLSSNCFMGELSHCWTYWQSLTHLNLGNNNLSGGNKLSGNLPSWMGETTTLMALRLRSNKLIGNIPPQICQLSSLIILDVANNSLSGTIPNCFNNFSLMETIGTEDDAFSVLEYSYYPLRIPEKMGRMKALESLDLSRNHLSEDEDFQGIDVIDENEEGLKSHGSTLAWDLGSLLGVCGHSDKVEPAPE
ncbi:LRR receptor-like serine/threonine-protein kinase ERL2 [Vitis vinifera]|uniref:LRR receptor-like serine/threonine-protein kinase ERL2 n=1 Tax=Vitis vinifera TaxID=29760 RepID=A0A438GIT2_VITVI|nr:LRR receptor-like serine/threonine-protein kinase ERL2 [Vitis vinifera]